MALEPWQIDLIGRKSEDVLVATADCPKCLSKNTVFSSFEGERIDDENGLMRYLVIRGEKHVCRDCWNEDIRRDSPWLGLALPDWHEAIRRGLSFDRVYHYTNWVRENIGIHPNRKL